jgi:hypothetical protein
MTGRTRESGPNIQHAYTPDSHMNRRKKLNQILKINAKKASAKLAPANKNKYISKADRLKLAEESNADGVTSSES